MQWDVDLFLLINGLARQSALLDELMMQVSRPGQLIVPVVLAAAYWLWQRRREALIGAPVLAGLIGLADFLGAQLKQVIARPRPCQALANVQEVVGCGGAFSFPSNHALNTATAAAFFQVLYPSTGWISWPLVALIGFSRVFTGGHYATDVVGGWILGGLFGAAAAVALRRWPTFRRDKPAEAVREQG